MQSAKFKTVIAIVMAITFTRAMEPVAGEAVTSTQMRSLARAVNDRLRSGVGDPTWRAQYLNFNLWRQVRLPADDAWPVQGEFQEYYQHIVAAWPDAAAGDPEGANTLSNPMMQFIFGSGANGTPDEFERVHVIDPDTGAMGLPIWIAEGPGGPGHKPATPEEFWALGKLQRGGVDINTGAVGSPAMSAAQGIYRIVQSPRNPMGKSFGGWMPIPEIIGDCGDGTTDSPPTTKYQFVFSPQAGSVKPARYFVGVCPQGSPEPGGGIGDPVYWIAETGFGWHVYRQDGVIEFLSKRDYYDGPYTGGATVRRTDGQQLMRVMSWFMADWRGNDAQRRNVDGTYKEFKIEEIAFDAQRFLTSQYFLAPARGVQISEDEVDATVGYPVLWIRSPLSTPGAVTNIHEVADGFVIAGVLVKATSLNGACEVEVTRPSDDPADQDEVMETFTLTPGADHTASGIFYFDGESLVGSTATRKVRFRMKSAVDSLATLSFELAELVDYKPGYLDGALVARIAAATGDDDEPNGADSGGAKSISDAYFAQGCLTALSPSVAGIGEPESQVNGNPAFDVARRKSREWMRVVPPGQLIGYEVLNGKSILYCKRYARGDSGADSFKDIAPSDVPIVSGVLIPGREYIVRAGTINYDGDDYAVGERFVATAATTYMGSATVLEYEGIRQTAPKNGTTNEWLMFPQCKVVHEVENSPYKLDAYGLQYAMNERCLCFNPRLTNFINPDLLQQFAYGIGTIQGPILTEGPTGWRYARTANTDLERAGFVTVPFYKSCRIYEPDLEIESCTSNSESGLEVVKIVMTGRAHHHESAPDTILRDLTSWDVAALEAEDYRTVESALREWILFDQTANPPSRKSGDGALGKDITDFEGNLNGAAVPHLFFTKLIPEPHEDGNDTQDQGVDTIVTVDALQQAEFYLRACCEGFVDGKSTLANACALTNATLWDYTYRNVCVDAFGHDSIGLFPFDVRPDNPEGFGPMPNTEMLAEGFARLSQAWNKLTRVRLMLPIALECRTKSYGENIRVPAQWQNGDCVGDGEMAFVWQGNPSATSANEITTDWAAGGGCSSVSSATGSDVCVGGGFSLTLSRTVSEFRFRIDDAVAYAVPPALKELVDTGAITFVACRSTSEETTTGISVGTLGASYALCCPVESQPCQGIFFSGGTGWDFTPAGSSPPCECIFISGGTLDAGAAPGGTFFFGRRSDGDSCAGGSSRSISVEPLGDNPLCLVEVPLEDLS